MKASKPSSTLSMLQQAATQALMEDTEEGTREMYIAADQIANSRGLMSPLRRGRSNSNLERSLELSQSFDRQSMIMERGIAVGNQLESSLRSNKSLVGTNGNNPPGLVNNSIAKDNEADALALLKQMNVEPVEQPETDAAAFHADVNAILAMAGMTPKEGLAETKQLKKSAKIKPSITSPKPFRSKSAGGRQRYLHRLQQSNRSSLNTMSGRSSYYTVSDQRGSLSSEPSRAAILLARAEEKSYGDRIRSSFQSEMQEMLFRSMQLVGPSRSLTGTSTAYSSSSSRHAKVAAAEEQKRMSQRLSQPASHGPDKLDLKFDPTLKYSTYDDAKESTFRPRIYGREKERRAEAKRRDEDDEDVGRKEDAKYSFISRQEAEERHRREELAYLIGKKDYDAQLNKKVCPKCGAKQSYDEVKEKRKFCPNCRAEYTIPLTWNKVSKQFFQKCFDYSQKVFSHKQQIAAEIEAEYRYIVRKEIDRHTGEVTLVRTERRSPLSREEEEDFLTRVQEHIDRHKETLRKLEKEIEEEYYPFRPQIARYLKRSKEDDQFDPEDQQLLDDEDFEDGGDAIKAFLRRYERDMETRREKMPTRYLPIRKYKKKSKKDESKDPNEDNDSDGNSDEDYEKKPKPFRF